MENFDQLITTIEQVHRQLQASAASAVKQSLTIRNWLFGYYIVEFEQNGEDRAVYGDKLIEKLAYCTCTKNPFKTFIYSH